jgi:protein-tyrosine phosphatase
MRHRVAEPGLPQETLDETPAPGAWHLATRPAARAGPEARARGIALDGSARRFDAADYDRLDLVLAMDEQNAHDLRALAPDAAARAKVVLLRGYDPAAAASGDLSVPDPYYGGPEGFSRVFAMVDAAVLGLLAHLRDGARRPG